MGREKFHYLNPVPIQRAYDRWVAKYARPWTGLLSGLKWTVEGPTLTSKPEHVYQIYIQAPPERVWQALTDPELTLQYYFGTRIEVRLHAWLAVRLPLARRLTHAGGHDRRKRSASPARHDVSPRAVWAKGRPSLTRHLGNHATRKSELSWRWCMRALDLNSDLGRGVQDGWTGIISAMKTLLEATECSVPSGDLTPLPSLAHPQWVAGLAVGYIPLTVCHPALLTDLPSPGSDGRGAGVRAQRPRPAMPQSTTTLSSLTARLTFWAQCRT